jgi:hypothetical protein
LIFRCWNNFIITNYCISCSCIKCFTNIG